MGKTQSREQIVVAQNGAGNQANTSLLHEITHDKLDILIVLFTAALFIVFCCLAIRCGKAKYTKFLRYELRGPRASGRRTAERPAPAYTVA